MNAPGWIDSLQWTTLFAAQMLATAGAGAPLMLGGVLGWGWLMTAPAIDAQSPHRRIGLRVLRGLVVAAALLLAAVLAIAWASAQRTGDAVLAAQLRASTVDSAAGVIGGGGIVAAMALLWSLRRRAPRPAQARRGQGL